MSGRSAIALVLVALAVIAGGVLYATARSDPPATVHAASAELSPSPHPTPAAASPVGPASVSPTPTPTPSATASRTPSAATHSASATGSAFVVATGWRTLSMVNRLDQTIWPAIAADLKHPISATGWVLAPGASLSILVPDHWDVRMWARTGCSFGASGVGSCTSGGCGRLECGSTWGEFPSTLAEFDLNAWNGMDFYDVSLVEGDNLPMWVNSYGGTSTDRLDANGCSAAGCTSDANPTCPAKLQRVRAGKVVACLSACLVFNTAQTCCTGAYAARSACVPSAWPIDSAAVFKKAEPFAYSYVDDDATSVLTCAGECNYRVTWGVSS